MSIIDRLKYFLGGYDKGGTGQGQQPASSEWLDSERFAQECDAMRAMWREQKKPDRYVEGPEDWGADPTWETVEFYFKNALNNKTEGWVILNLSYPLIPFIQACRASHQDENLAMNFHVRFCDDRIEDGTVVLLEKTLDTDACREAFRVYFESGEVWDLDQFSRCN